MAICGSCRATGATLIWGACGVVLAAWKEGHHAASQHALWTGYLTRAKGWQPPTPLQEIALWYTVRCTLELIRESKKSR